MKRHKEKMPVLFIGHGSPINMILNNSFTDSLVKLGRELPKPKAIMVISAHWLTSGTFVGCMKKPKMIYDFYGFPPELYKIKYECPGAPELSKTITSLAPGRIKCSNEWGIDHASYAILKYIFPSADIPVFELSLDYSFNDWRPKSVDYHYKLAKTFFRLREQGILIIGSGNIVHNLNRIDYMIDADPYAWAQEIDEKFKWALLKANHEYLFNYPYSGKEASLAVPTLDHYLPMIYTIALREKNEALAFTYEGTQNASISMRCFKIG